MNAKKVISYFWQQARRYRLLTLGTLIMPSFAILVHTFLSTLIVATIIDKLAQVDYIKHDFIGSFGGLILLYIGTYLLGNVLLYRLVTFLSWRLDMRITRAINMQVFQHLLTLDTNFHTNRLGGTLVTQASKLSSAYERFSDTTINSFLPLVSTIIFTTVILLPRAPLYLPILFLLAAGYLTIALKTSQRIRHFNTRHAKANSHQFGLFADAITNIFTVKSFGREAYEKGRYKLAANKTFQASDNLLMATINRDTKFSLAGSSFSIASIITVVIGVMYFNISLGTAFLMLTYSLSIAQRLWDFSSKGLRQYNQVFGEAHEMLGVLNTKPEVIDSQKTKQAISSPTGISFNVISFSHPDTHEALFDKFSLTIKPGEKVGLVGHSGAGKSSLASLLLRFSEINAGTIKIGQHDITSLSQEDLRHHIAYVPQEPLLFHRSIKENISYGKSAVSDADIEEAARRANAYDFIGKLPQGFDTIVGERGIKLSGGQRQRIAIARAILKDAPILVLDEATSALDSESEKLIQASLDELMKDRTALVIAHRLSTIAKLDRVVVMEHGRIIEDGTHKTLLNKQGVYAKLWQHQSGGFIEE